MSIPPLYHLSFNHHLPTTLNPLCPAGEYDLPEEQQVEKGPPDPDAWIFAEFKTPRVSFAPTAFHCIQAIYANTHEFFQSLRGQKEGLEFAVYRYDPRKRSRIMLPEELSEQRAVWDAHITQEYCFLDPVQIYYSGSINVKVKKDIRGFDVHPFNDPSMKAINSTVPKIDEVTFFPSVKLRGDKYKVRLFP